MKKETYQKLIDTVPNFVEEHCFWIYADKLLFDPATSQTRQNGHAVARVPAYKEVYESHEPEKAPFPPADIVHLPNQDKYQLKDGCTRTLAAQEASKPILVSDYYDKLGWNTDQWDDYQSEANDHNLSSPNTEEDIKHKIKKQIQHGRIKRLLGHGYKNHENDFVEGASKHFRYKLFKNSGKSLEWFRRRVRSALEPQTLVEYENYTKTTAFEFMKLRENFNGKETGAISNNEVWYSFRSTKHLNPNMIGYLAHRSVYDPGVKVNFVFWVSSLVGKKPEDVVRIRKQVKTWHDDMKPHFSNLGKLVFLPQIKNGPSADDLNKLIKAR
tara:strand:+ start:26 stop:1006 length:981 start_codon:yes stop_codon:yes gene_type:complete